MSREVDNDNHNAYILSSSRLGKVCCGWAAKCKLIATEVETMKYQNINSNFCKTLREAKEKWLNQKYEEMEKHLETNVMAKAYTTVKELWNIKSMIRIGHFQDKSGTKLSEPDEILNRWTEYCEEFYN